MVWCGTHSPELLTTLRIDRLLSALTRILRERGQPLEAVIYDAVMEALQPNVSDPPVQYESPCVQEAIDYLLRQDWFSPMGLNQTQAQAIFDSYHKELNRRARLFALRWIQRSLLQPRDAPLWQRTLSSLMLEREETESDLTVANLKVRDAINCPRTQSAIRHLAAAGDEVLGGGVSTAGYSMACFISGATSALANVDFCRYYGPIYSTIDVYCNRHYHRRIPTDSSSRAIVAAFDKCSDEPQEVARRWIQSFYAYADKKIRHVALEIAMVAFQMALGLTDSQGLDYFHEMRFAEGLRQVLLTARTEQLLEALPGAAPVVVPPKTLYIMFKPYDQALQIRDITYGAIWGLKAMQNAEI